MQTPPTAKNFDHFTEHAFLKRETKLEDISVGLGHVANTLVVIVRYNNGYEARKTWVNLTTYDRYKMAEMMRKDYENTKAGRADDDVELANEAAKGRERRQERGPRGKPVQ